MPDSGCSSLLKIGNGCRNSREKHQKMSRNLENMERLKEMRLFSLGLRGEIQSSSMSKVAAKGKGVNCSPWPVVGGQEVLSSNCSKGNKC